MDTHAWLLEDASARTPPCLCNWSMAIRLMRTDSEHQSDDCSEVKMLTARGAKVPRSEKGSAATPEVKHLSELDQANGLLLTSKLPAMLRSASGHRMAALAELLDWCAFALFGCGGSVRYRG